MGQRGSEAQGTLDNVGLVGAVEGVSQAGETYSIHDLEPEDGEQNTGLADRLLP